MAQCCEVCDIARKLDGRFRWGTMMSESKAASDGRRGTFDVDDAWLEGRKEDAIDPELPIASTPIIISRIAAREICWTSSGPI
jgi:hypothetical protein